MFLDTNPLPMLLTVEFPALPETASAAPTPDLGPSGLVLVVGSPNPTIARGKLRLSEAPGAGPLR